MLLFYDFDLYILNVYFFFREQFWKFAKNIHG